MTMDLKQLFEVVGERISLDEALDFSDRTLFGTHPFVTPVQVTGEIANQAGVVVLSMQLTYTMHLTCDRCLDEFERAFSCSWEHLLVAEPLTDDSDTENIEVPDGLLNLDELVWADILLNLPSKLLCREDCKGLCPQCGQNRNHGSCSCTEKTVDPRWAALDELLK